jgi:lipopolysaccharide transport system ATP-binding protein
MSEIAIRVENLSKLYHLDKSRGENFKESLIKYTTSLFNRHKNNNSSKELWALKDISFELKKGEVTGIIGPNGSGKSTLLKIISKVTPPTIGSIEINGKVASILDVGIGFQNDLTGIENIYLSGKLYGLSKKEVDKNLDDIIKMFGFPDFINTQVKYYSTGMYMRLAFALVTHVQADIYLFDEVLSVGDAQFRKNVQKTITDLKNKNKSILIVTHLPNQIVSVCDTFILLWDASINNIGQPLSVINSYNIQENFKQKNNQQEKCNIQILKASGKQITNFRFNIINDKNDEIIVQIMFETEITFEDISINLLIKDNNDTPIGETKNKISRGISPGLHEIEIIFPKTLLMSGTYPVDLIIFENNTPIILAIYIGQIFVEKNLNNNRAGRILIHSKYLIKK